MLDDTRLDTKLQALSRELTQRAMVPGYGIADAYAVYGLDEAGKPGLFAAILLAPGRVAELETLTAFRQLLTQRLKQLDTRTPAWPIVVQSAPEVLDGGRDVVPGGPDYFAQVKVELQKRTERMRSRITAPQLPVVDLPALASTPAPARAKAPPAAKPAARAKARPTARKAPAAAARRTVPARASARTARARR